uniref:Bromodomain containing, putative n=1 Tax=Schistosoma mansoni TaxID=6183 RepID=A0A3Q0KSG7_SCHMA
MLNEMNSGGLHCVADSDNALKLKISFSGGKCSQDCSVSSESDVLTEVTSRNLYTVLSEIHQNLVRRDPRGIFANPVTDDIAVGYSEVISKPMDLGTIYNRLKSRAYYRSATEYLADVTLMCNNAMVYNPPDTIYYQRARKLLAFCRKQMTVSSLQKACKDIPGGLTVEEIGDLTSVEAEMNQMNRVKPFHRSSKLHTHSQSELSDHKFRFSPKRVDSNRNIPPTVQPLVNHSFQKHRGRPKSHLSTSSRLYHINRKALKSYSHFSSEEHLSRDDLKKKNNNDNTEKCISTVEFKKSFASLTSSKKVQLTHQDTSIRSSVNTPILPIPHRRGRGRPRKIKIDDIQTSSGSSTLNISTQLQDSSLISSNSTPIDGKRHSENLSTLSHDHYSRSICVNNSFENSITGHSNLSLGPTQSEYENSLTESVMKIESNSQYTQEFLNNEPIVLLNIAPSTPSSSPLSGSSCKTFIGKTSFVSKKSQKLSSDIQSNKLSQFKMDRNKEMFNYLDKTNSVNDEDSVYNDSCDENVERSHHQIVDNVPNEILIQAKKAAEESAAKLKRKYEFIASSESNNEYIGPKIMCLNCSNQGEISAVECPKARSSINSQHYPNLSNYNNDNISENEESSKPRPNYNVSYPPFLIDLLTKSKLLNTQKMDDHSLSKQNKILDDLNKLKYNIDEPIAGAIHGPLAIFSAAQLAQLSDVYGGDPSVIEYAISLLKFVQPMGRWARRWAAKRLDAATDGLHSQACYTLSSQPAHTVEPTFDKDKSDLLQNWTDVVDITIDPPTPKVDQSDVEQPEPCLVDLLNQYDTVISCSNDTNSSVLSTSNESAPCVVETTITYIKKDNLNSVNTSSLSGSLDIPVSINSCSVSFCNNDMSNSQLVSDSALNVSNIPQQNSSTREVDDDLDDVIICESVPPPIATHTPNVDVILQQYNVNDAQQSEKLPLIATKLPEDEITITDECASSSVKSVDYVVPSDTPSLNEHELDSVDHINNEQISEISADSSNSLLKTALSGSSFSLNTSHDRITVQNKGTVDGLEDSFGNLSSGSDCSTVMSTHSLFLDSHLITHKELPVSVPHIENQIAVNHCNPISSCSETTDSLTDPVVQNQYGEIYADNRVNIDADSAIFDTAESSHSLILSNSMLLDNTCETNEQLTSNNNISSVS